MPHGAYSRGALVCKSEFLAGGVFERAFSDVGAYSRIYGNGDT